MAVRVALGKVSNIVGGMACRKDCIGLKSLSVFERRRERVKGICYHELGVQGSCSS